MKLLFLRGEVDKRTQQVDQLNLTHDMWTHLAANLCGDNDYCMIAYQGGNRIVEYEYNIHEVWTPKFKNWKTNYVPDVVFARGGFGYYAPVLKRFPKAVTVYYGAGKRSLPEDGFQYDLVIVDSLIDLKRSLKKFPKSLSVVWTKPTIERRFMPTNHCKLYDICYVANGQQAEIKRVKWVYKTLPKKYFMLHLGYKSKHTPPVNVEVKRVVRQNMPGLYNSCKIGIVPYSSYDSAPRAMSEMLACGLPVVVMDSVRHNYTGPKVITATKKTFWEAVDVTLKNLNVFGNEAVTYMDSNVEYLKRAINEARQRKNSIIQR